MWILAFVFVSAALVALRDALSATSQWETVLFSLSMVLYFALAVTAVIQVLLGYDIRPAVNGKGSNGNHPETRRGEVFLRNETPGGFARIGWKTKRMGSVAYGEHGNRLEDELLLFPVFIKMSEFAKTGLPDKVLRRRVEL